MTRLIVISLTLLISSNVRAVSVEKDLSLTLREKQILDKFRDQVTPLLTEDYMKTDIYLIRWLRAKNFNINDAEAMLKENLRWRETRKMKGIMQENFDDMWRDFPATVDTHDKEKRPIGVIDIYYWDIRSAQLGGRGPRLLRYMDYLMENVTRQVNHGCPICMPLWVQFLSSLENHYQGWMNEFIIIEAPGTVNTMFDLLRPFLSRQTRDAIKIFGMNKNQWMPYMDARIKREERRIHYGGTKPN